MLPNRRDRQVAARAGISPQPVHRAGDEQVICLQDLLKDLLKEVQSWCLKRNHAP